MGQRDIHLLPKMEWRAHDESLACWCVPTLRRVPGSTAYVVMHNETGREQLKRRTTTISRALDIPDDAGTATAPQ